MKSLTEQEKIDFYNRFKNKQKKENQVETKVEIITPEDILIEEMFAERLRKYPPLIENFK